MICKKCGTENLEENEFCSKCGKKLTEKKKMDSKKKKIIIFGIIAITLIGIILVFSLSKENYTDTDNVNFEIQQEEFTISNETLDYSSVTGIIKNNTNNIYKSVIVSCLLYDEEGNTLGKAYDSIEFLGANESWEFDATPLDSEIRFSTVKSFSIEEVVGTKVEDDKIITKDFDIYNTEWGKGTKDHPDDSNYQGIYIESDIKNISGKDYNEPFTIIYSVKSKSSGYKLCTYYHTLNSLKSNATTNYTTQTPYDYYAYVKIKYSSSKGLYFDSIYDVSVACVIQGELVE